MIHIINTCCVKHIAKSFIMVAMILFLGSCSQQSEPERIVQELENCLGEVKTQEDAQKMSKEEAVSLAECMLPRMKSFKEQFKSLSKDESKKLGAEMSAAIDASEYKELIEAMSLRKLQRLIDSKEAMSSNNVSSANTQLTKHGSKDWDKMLDDYEEYVDQYIVFYKKALKGDNSAMTEYPAMMEKATSLQESMITAQNNDELSVSQVQRMSRIQSKMINGISGN